VSGDLPRTSAARRSLGARGTGLCGLVLALTARALLAVPLAAAQPAEGIPAPALRKMAEVRRLCACLVGSTDDTGQDLVFHGRPSLEIKGRVDGAAGPVRDLGVFDPASGLIVTYVCFPNASTRASGEAIVSLADVSGRADALARALLPGSQLGLESVKRRLSSETASVYYEALYAAPSGDFPFLEPPLRLLLNATSGSLFRLDIDPDWLDPPHPPRVQISRKSAERIAAVVLRGRDLATVFGPGAVLGPVAAAELFVVHPNDWLGSFTRSVEAAAQVAWVVPFRVEGGAAAGLHSLFVDAATGHVLGGLPGQAAELQPR